MPLTEGVDQGIQVDSIARAQYLLSHIDKFLHVVERAEVVHNSLPKEMRELFDPVGLLGSFNEEAMLRLAFQMAEFPPPMISAIKLMFHELRQYVGIWVDPDNDDEELMPFTMLDVNDMKVIEEMVTFSQNCGARSVRQLLQFLEAANAGDWSICLIQAQGKSVEVRMRFNLSDEALNEFGLERKK